MKENLFNIYEIINVIIYLLVKRRTFKLYKDTYTKMYKYTKFYLKICISCKMIKFSRFNEALGPRKNLVHAEKNEFVGKACLEIHALDTY